MKAEEYDAIRAELYPPSWRDPGLIPECFALALDALRDVAVVEPGHVVEDPRFIAEQALRRMVQRVKTGIPIYEAEDIRG